MILQALAEYYDAKQKMGEIVREGWSPVRISYALVLNKEGQIIEVMPLRQQIQKGKKMTEGPKSFEMPQAVIRASNIKANFLWDTSSYILGVDEKGKPERSKQCFEASRELHLALLGDCSSEAAKAVCAYFQSWDPELSFGNPQLQPYWKEIIGGVNLTFRYGGKMVHEDPEMINKWDHYGTSEEEDVRMGRCLVTGKYVPIAKLHTPIKGVWGAQPTGAALVSFNAPAFTSYGKEQSYNAPVGEHTVFAYTTALNDLLRQTDHVQRIGDSTVLCWAQNGESTYQNALMQMVYGENELTEQDLFAVMQKISEGEPVDWEDKTLNPNMKFYVLGLAPNAARLSVRFFLQDSFGSFINNIKEHYNRMEIVKPSYDEKKYIFIRNLLFETVNKNAKDKSASPLLSGAVLKAVLKNERYPEMLRNAVLMRIRAEQQVTRGRAAILKAFLLKNTSDDTIREVLQVQLNENTDYQPYVLGRLFALLEEIQQTALPGIKATIKDRYFNIMSSSPGAVFTQLMKLQESHMKVIKREKPGAAVNLSKKLLDLTSRLNESVWNQLNIQDQGIFMLGYYHQTQKRYEGGTNNGGNNSKQV